MDKVQKFVGFLDNYYDALEPDGGAGSGGKLPDFELGARDYLEFAESSLKNKNTLGLINCVSNLKRAIDCQLDTFFYITNLYELFKKRNLKIDKKLEFIEKIGLFSSRSLAKLNKIRNKMEHNYAIPDISEIELYFELVEALIRSLEMAVTMLMSEGELSFIVNDLQKQVQLGRFSIEYNYQQKTPFIIVKWKLGEEKDEICVSIKEYEEFAYFMRVLFLLYQREYITSKSYIKNKMRYTG